MSSSSSASFVLPPPPHHPSSAPSSTHAQLMAAPPPPRAWFDGLDRRDLEQGSERMRMFPAGHQQQYHLTQQSAFASAGYPYPTASASYAPAAYVYGLPPPPIACARPNPSVVSSSYSLPHMSAFLDPRPPPGQQAYLAPLPSSSASSSASFSRTLPLPIVSPARRNGAGGSEMYFADPIRVFLPLSPSVSRSPYAERQLSPRSPTSSAAVRKRRSTTSSQTTSVALKSRPSLEDVLRPVAPSDKDQQPFSDGAEQRIKIREASVGSDVSSEFDILEPYIHRPSPAFPLPTPQFASASQTPMRSSTSLPALLADLNSDDEDEDDLVNRSGEHLLTPSGSLLDNVLSGSVKIKDGEKHKWAMRHRMLDRGAEHGRSPQTKAMVDKYRPSPPRNRPTDGTRGPIAKSQSFPHHFSHRTNGAPSATPSRPFHSSNTLADSYSFPSTAIASRSPGGILTPYRASTASGTGSETRIGQSSERPNRMHGHRREPSRAETECYWQSSPSDSTQEDVEDEVDLMIEAELDRKTNAFPGSEEEEDDDDELVRERAVIKGAREVFGSEPSLSPVEPPFVSQFAQPTLPRPASAARQGYSHAIPPFQPPLAQRPLAQRPLAQRPLLHPPAIRHDGPAAPRSNLGWLAEAAVTVEQEDGRSSTSDKENRERLGFGDDVFSDGKGKDSVVGLSAVPSLASATIDGCKPKSKKKKSGPGVSPGASTSPVIQECDLPPVNVPSGHRSSAKPTYSYAAMIGQAILAHPKARLSLAEIYNWISSAYPFYRKGEAGWMNSIRHNLSLNKCFIKVERNKVTDGGVVVIGKGMLWAIEAGCVHQFEGGGFNKSGKAASKPKAGGSAARPKSSTPVPASGKSKKRKAGALTEDSDSTKDETPPPAPANPIKRIKVFLNSSPQYLSDAEHPASPAASSIGESPDVGTQPLPALAPAFQPVMARSVFPTNAISHSRGEDAKPGTPDDLDDYATPQRPLSRGPSTTSVVPSSQEMPPPASCLRGLPHLTPSVSSPASSSPAQPFVSRPRAIQAHQALQRSSLGQSDNVTIVEDTQSYDAGLTETSQAPSGLQPGFQMASKSSLSPCASGIPPPSPTHPRFQSSVAPGIQSPMSSLRATAHIDEAETPYGYPYAQGGHLSPLHNRKISAGGDRARGLTASGELVHHAIYPPSAGTTFKTPGMQPIASSPRETLPQPWSFQSASGPLSPGRPGVRASLASATPKSSFGYLSSYGLSAKTPARTPVNALTRSPAGAALLQRRAELGILATELTYGEEDASTTKTAIPTALSGDPYDSSIAVEDELRQISSKVEESPGGWGGGGRTIATPGANLDKWNEAGPSPGYGASPSRPRYVYR